MTREKAIKELSYIADEMPSMECADWKEAIYMAIKALEQEPTIGYCKNCKWWKDSDGKYRRGIRAESECLLNTDVVYYGLGYCYMFEPLTVKE